MQLTLVSHYGPKPALFADRIRLLQSLLAAHLGDGFKPYAVEQVHGTILGLEGTRLGERVRSENFRRYRNSERFIDFPGLLDFLRTRMEPDWNVRLGGFAPDRDHGFTSAGQHPFVRSFSLRGEIAVAMGWPQCDGVLVPALDELRRQGQSFGALHKWHQNEADVDNDYFFVLGRVSPGLDPAAHGVAQQIIREHLATAPLFLPVTRDTLAFVAYSDPQLPLATSRMFRLTDEHVTPELLASFYDATKE